jgi:hypothetical protein
MLKLTYSQPHFESGSISGEGVDWWWGDRTLNGPDEIVEEISEAANGACREKYDKHLTEEANRDLDFGFEAEIEWDGSSSDVTDCQIILEYSGADLDAVLVEAQELFTTELKPDKPLAVGENVIKLGEDENGDPVTVTIEIEE